MGRRRQVRAVGGAAVRRAHGARHAGDARLHRQAAAARRAHAGQRRRPQGQNGTTAAGTESGTSTKARSRNIARYHSFNHHLRVDVGEKIQARQFTVSFSFSL